MSNLVIFEQIPLSCSVIATMSKRHSLVDPRTQPSASSSKQSEPAPSTNWDICVLCQEVTDEPLQCPLRNTKKQSVGSGYVSLAEDLARFRTLQHMPMDLNLERLNDEDGIESTLRRHKAGWHKSCRLKFNKRAYDVLSQKLNRGLQSNKNMPLLYTHNLRTDIRSQQSLHASFAISPQQLLRVYTMHQPTTLMQMCGSVPLLLRTRLCWPSFPKVTWLLLKLSTITLVLFHCTTRPGRLHRKAMMKMEILACMA